MDKKTLGKKIKQAREQYSIKCKKTITQKILGELVGKSQSYIGDIENGRAKPSAELLNAIAEVLELDVQYFLDDNNQKETLNIDSIQLSELISKAVKENTPTLSDLEKQFPSGVKIINIANEKLNDSQKTKMIQLMEWFIENELPKTEKD